MNHQGKASTAVASSPIARLYDAALAPGRRPAMLDEVALRCGAHGGWVFDVSHRGDFACRVAVTSTAWRLPEGTSGAWASEHARHGATHLFCVARGRPGIVRVEKEFSTDPAGMGRRADVRWLRERLDVFERCALRLDDHPARPYCLVSDSPRPVLDSSDQPGFSRTSATVFGIAIAGQGRRA